MKRIIIIFLLVVLSTTLSSAQRGIYDLPDPFADTVQISSTITTTHAGRILTSNTFTDTVTLLNLDRTIQAEFSIGDNPTSVALTEDGLRAVAVSDSSLGVIDLTTTEIIAGYEIDGMPFGVVTNDDFAYVSLQNLNQVIIMDITDGRIIERIDTPEAPSGLARWGNFLYVSHFWSGEMSMIYLPNAEVVRTIQPNPQGALFASIEIDPINGLAFLPMSIANISDNATVGNRIIPMLYEVDLRTLAVTRSINLAAADRNLNIPYAVRQPSNRTRLYIAYAGSDAVTVLNLDTGAADNHFETGASPRGLVFSNDFTRIYTQDAVDVVVSIYDTRFFALEDQLPTSVLPIDPQIQIGARLFYSATDTRLNSNGLMSCASCHWGQQSDGNVWLGASTPDLSDGVVVDTEWINQHIDMLQRGTGLNLDSIDMDALVTYLNTP